MRMCIRVCVHGCMYARLVVCMQVRMYVHIMYVDTCSRVTRTHITHTPAVHTRVLPLAIILVAVAPSTDSLDSHGTVRTEDSPGRMMLVFACKCAMHRLVSYSTKCSALCSQPSSQSLLPLHEPERMQASLDSTALSSSAGHPPCRTPCHQRVGHRRRGPSGQSAAWASSTSSSLSGTAAQSSLWTRASPLSQ